VIKINIGARGGASWGICPSLAFQKYVLN